MWWLLPMATVLVTVLIPVSSGQDFPYATGFPYVKYEYGKGNRNTQGGADENGYLQNKLSDAGNNIKAAQDLGKFYNMENVSNGHSVQHMKQGTSADSQKSTTGEDFENDKTHKRKHVKSGFHNTYHKDESGSNSSFYEDSDDKGGKLVYDKRHGVKGDTHGSTYNEGLRDGASKDKLNNRFGGYDTRGSQDRQHFTAEDQGNRHGHRDGYNRGQGSVFEAATDGNRGTNGYYQEPYRNRYENTGDYGLYRPNLEHNQLADNYIRSPHYDMQLPTFPTGGHSSHRLAGVRPRPGEEHDFFNRPMNHRITIYEDPRDLIDPRAERRRGGGNDFPVTPLERGPLLDFRPSPIRFREYDNYRYRNY